MGDKWQLEAIQQQFEVFGSLKTPHTVIAVDNFRALLNVVKPVIDQHLQSKNTNNVALRKICAEIIKNIDDNQKEIKFSFVVIVLNEDFNRSLARIPVFTITCGNQRLFVDINCSVYKNWNTFMNSNSLPACEFCHPVDGQYNVGRSLKIDFKKSPATLKVSRLYLFTVKLVPCIVAVAATFFVTVKETSFKRVKQFIGIAQKFFPTFPISKYLELATLVDKFKKGEIEFHDLLGGLDLLKNIFFKHEEDILPLWEEVKSHFKSLCNYIHKQLQRFFASASPASQHKFLAITQKVDTEISNLEEKAEQTLNAEYEVMLGRRNAESTRGQFPVSAMDSKNSTVPSYSVSDTNTYVHGIFKNCQNDFISHEGQKDNKSDLSPSTQFFGRGTQELVSISANIAKHLQKENLSDVESILSSLSSVVQAEYNHKINTYVKMRKAARASARNEINIQAFNDALGIKGHPKDHYWNEAIKCTQEYRCGLLIKTKIDEIRKNNKIVCIPVSTLHEGSIEGFHRCIGIQGEGRISASAILNTLKERFSYLNERDVVINESHPEQILISTDLYTIVAYQNIDEYNTAEGMVIIVRH